jgi:hypothetical protein
MSVKIETPISHITHPTRFTTRESEWGDFSEGDLVVLLPDQGWAHIHVILLLVVPACHLRIHDLLATSVSITFGVCSVRLLW